MAKIHLNFWQRGERQVSNYALAAVYMIILQSFNYFRKMFQLRPLLQSSSSKLQPASFTGPKLKEEVLERGHAKALCAMPVWVHGTDLCLADTTPNHWGFRSAAPGENIPVLWVKAEICGERNMHSATDSSESLRNIPKYNYSSTRVLTRRDSATAHTLNSKANLLNEISVQRQLETYLILLGQILLAFS